MADRRLFGGAVRRSRAHNLRNSRIALILVIVLAVLACAAPAICEEKPAPETVTSMANPAAAGATVLGKVQKVAVGSKGATITLDGGKQVNLDFGGLNGAAGGANYIGWAMVLFGLSVVTRLLSTIARILRPFSAPRRREGYAYERR